MSGTLCLHAGARTVQRTELATVPVPPATRTWHPVGHVDFLAEVERSLLASGFTIERERHALSRGDCRYFGVIDLRVEIAPDVTLSCGIRNSTDQSFPLGFAAGHRVFVCDNLAFSAELMAKRKHSRFGLERFRSDIALCVSKLDEFRLAEQSRIERMINTPICDMQAESLMLRAIEDRLVSPRIIYRLIEAWRDPGFEEFKDRTMWSLYNAFTLVLGDQARAMPDKHARTTMQLQSLLAPKGADGANVIDVPYREDDYAATEIEA